MQRSSKRIKFRQTSKSSNNPTDKRMQNSKPSVATTGQPKTETTQTGRADHADWGVTKTQTSGL